jgi:HlyD family type I secretion membrane fusion protein
MNPPQIETSVVLERTPVSLAGFLEQGRPDPAARAEWRRLVWRTLLALAPIAVLLAAWVSLAPLAGAVIAPAQVKVELNRKTVQHQEGGIVREIRVHAGQQVSAGDVLLVIGDVRSDADLDLQRDALLAASARKARAAAEAALEPRFAGATQVDLTAHEAAVTATTEHMARERALFVAHRRALDDEIGALQAQIRQAQAQSTALQARIDATEASARYADDELRVNQGLVEQGFISRTKMLELQRAAADYRARVAEFRSDLAAVAQRTGELQSHIAEARNKYLSQATDELKEASARVREAQQRMRPSSDQVERQLVRSPVDGQVMDLRVSALGEAVGPRAPLLDVVPAREKLVVEARIRPEDIEHVKDGAAAEVRLSGIDVSVVRPLQGTVTFVSPDRMTDPAAHEAWFVATVEVDAAALKNRPDVRLMPGMPAEVFVTTAERSLLAYLTKPFAAFNSRALREP